MLAPSLSATSEEIDALLERLERGIGEILATAPSCVSEVL
jgi:hypothetical protein